MKTHELSDEKRRQHLNYEERREANRLLMKLWEMAPDKQKRDWDRFAVLIQRSCRIPPGPEGADTPGCAGFSVGQEWRDGTGSGIVKALRICGELREVFGLIQIDSYDLGLVWLKLGELDLEESRRRADRPH